MSLSLKDLGQISTSKMEFGSASELGDLASYYAASRSPLESLGLLDSTTMRAAQGAFAANPSLSDLTTGHAASKLALGALGMLDSATTNSARGAFGASPSLSDLATLGLNERGPHAASLLGGLDQRVYEDQKRWDKIERSFNDIQPNISPPSFSSFNVPDLVDRLEDAVTANSEHERTSANQQRQLLAAIVKAGKEQNATMSNIAKLQTMLVEEAIENTKIQKLVIYLSALSAALSLVTLILSK